MCYSFCNVLDSIYYILPLLSLYTSDRAPRYSVRVMVGTAFPKVFDLITGENVTPHCCVGPDNLTVTCN
jgi:hypothetical protein